MTCSKTIMYVDDNRKNGVFLAYQLTKVICPKFNVTDL